MIQERFHRGYEWLIALLIFFVPSNLFLKLFEQSGYVHGLLVDYLIPKLYVSDLVIFALLGLWVWEFVQTKKQRIRFLNWFTVNRTRIIIGGILIGIFLTRQFLTAFPLASVWYLIKLLEMCLLAVFLFHHQSLLLFPLFKRALVITLAFQSVLALLQWQTQHSLVGYYFFGESNLSNYIGLAKGVFNGVEKTLPYGTTAHPNILGGVLAIYLLLLLPIKKMWWKEYPVLTGLFLLLVGMALFLTQSLTAWATLGIGLLLLKNKKNVHLKNRRMLGSVVIGVLLATPVLVNIIATNHSNFTSITRRANLNQAAVEMLTANPLFGVGLNNFTARVEEYGNFQEVVRFVQPVHHVGLLWLSETGLLGLLLIGVSAYLISIKSWKALFLPIIILLPTLSLDHYALTQQSGLLVMVFLFVVYRTTLSGISSEA